MTDISSQTLHIVAKELAATLNDARASLEAYAERSDQRTLLERCADQLHSATAFCDWSRSTAPRSSPRRWSTSRATC